MLVQLCVDAGRTEFHGVPTATCCAIGPDWPERIDPITGHLKLCNEGRPGPRSPLPSGTAPTPEPPPGGNVGRAWRGLDLAQGNVEPAHITTGEVTVSPDSPSDRGDPGSFRLVGGPGPWPNYQS